MWFPCIYIVDCAVKVINRPDNTIVRIAVSDRFGMYKCLLNVPIPYTCAALLLHQLWDIGGMHSILLKTYLYCLSINEFTYVLLFF